MVMLNLACESADSLIEKDGLPYGVDFCYHAGASTVDHMGRWVLSSNHDPEKTIVTDDPKVALDALIAALQAASGKGTDFTFWSGDDPEVRTYNSAGIGSLITVSLIEAQPWHQE